MWTGAHARNLEDRMPARTGFVQLGRTFAAEASGFDLRAPLSAAHVEAIEQGLAQYGVVVFRDQNLDVPQQTAFIRNFGPDRNAGFKEVAGANPMFVDVGTVDDAGKPIPLDSARGQYLLANRLWHTDGSFLERPIRLTALLARELPPRPPPTQYADMRAAWDALPRERQAELDGLRVVHSIVRSREQMGFTAEKFDARTLKDHPSVEHPLVRTHPANGRKSLYLASHASHIVGWPLERGRALVEELIAFATQPRFVYEHTWRLHDMVMWDDRWTMHRATPYDDPHPRKMRQAAVHETQAV
jgi:alpha-ketoglutarate-dependent 2,4-dichlorophenoxyacetate dioxygenase